MNTGYISESVAGEDGTFSENPTVELVFEARYKCFGLTLEFGRNHPDTMIFHAYLENQLMEDYLVTGISEIEVVNHEFPEFDRLVLEFTKGVPRNRVVLDNIYFGDSTDYELAYGCELLKTPKGTQLPKVRELQVVRTLYRESEEVKELIREVITLPSADHLYTFYLFNPSFAYGCALAEPKAGQSIKIVESSCYMVTVSVTGVTGAFEVIITGKEYTVTQTKVSRKLNPTGSLETWENPLVSDSEHGIDLADWIGDYMRADREYDLTYRGEPRIDANDILFLENKYVPDLLLKVYDHTLNFNGALSGSMKARRDMSGVATAKNRLESR